MANYRWVEPKKVKKPVGWRDLISGQVTTQRRPNSSSIRTFGTSQQRGHWVSPGGRWLGFDRNVRPGTRTGGSISVKGPGIGYPGDYTPGTYSGGLSDEELQRRANALADSQIAYQQAQIERQRAAAYAQAQ